MSSANPDRSPEWIRDGLVLARGAFGAGNEVVGDPCVVWDEDEEAWRMFLFFDPPGHASSLARTVDPEVDDWLIPEPLTFTDDAPIAGRLAHKPFIVLDPHRPNRAARVGGLYWLLLVTFDGPNRSKQVRRASSTRLGGPWRVDESVTIPAGGPRDFDGLHADAVTGYWFEAEQEFVYFYMGYPAEPQPYAHSPYASSVGVATQRRGDPAATKRGIALAPSDQIDHWASGWLGGLQLLPGIESRWIAVLNASPTPPDRDGTRHSQEPAPSLGGFARSDSLIGLDGWKLDERPIEWIDDIPSNALAAGEGTNLWRQHIHLVGDHVRLYYNSGAYGQEQLYRKSATASSVGIRSSNA
jgi:hypothetical protein